MSVEEKSRERLVLDAIQKHIKGAALQAEAAVDMNKLEVDAYEKVKTDMWTTGSWCGVDSASRFINLMIERLDMVNDYDEQQK